MTDLRKAAEQALEAFEKIYEGCGEVKKDNLSKHSNELATLVRKDCIPQIEALRQALTEPANSTTGFVEPKAPSQMEQKTPLKVLNLTVFTENRLRNGRVYDVETLQAMTNRDILSIPDIGKKALAEVLEALAKLKEKNT